MEQYPGQNTDFFFVSEDVPSGPVKGLSELSRYNITPDTPVWYEGLEDWQPAIMAPLTRQLFDARSPYFKALAEGALNAGQSDNTQTSFAPEQPPALEDNRVVNSGNATPGMVHPYAAPLNNTLQNPTVPKPKTYMVWAIIVTFLCNMIAGIVAIFFSWRVSTKYLRGDYEGAERSSERAQWWIAISICVGLIAVVANLFMGRLF